MASRPRSALEPFAPDAPLKFVGGDPSVDFVNTVNWGPQKLDRDRLSSYGRVLEWARGAGLLGAAASRRLAQEAMAQPRRADTVLRRVYDVREVLHDVFAAIVDDRQNASALDRFNALVVEASTHVRLVRGGSAPRLSRSWSGEEMDAFLWPVIWAASDLVTSDEVARLRRCAGEECGWFFVDRSRNGLRRWCEMSDCGTAEKNRRRAGK